ncbi:MAG TPA: hypothetical protein VFQ67_06355 [Allosphingosinicella sp.]|jgi:hypothetical protein|nr:hypothetical protein [Allosphingosinicella sp.]
MAFQYLRCAIAAAALGLASVPAAAQDPAPPQVPLWRVLPNGDAVQTDLGFQLPARWKAFERKGFSSGAADGTRVATLYERADGPIRMRIILQPRADTQASGLPGSDGVERNWPFLEKATAADYPVKGEELVESRVVWGRSDKPNARMRLVRYPIPGKAEIQGLWSRNIGLWSVAVVVWGPEDRRVDIEQTGTSAMTEMGWPSAPLSADLKAIAPEFLRGVKSCATVPSGGNGQPARVNAAIASVMGMGVVSYFTEVGPKLPHPVLEPDKYCRVETFKAGTAEITALAWQGPAAASWTATYAFFMAETGAFYQIESLFDAGPSGPIREQLDALGIRRLVQLTFTDSSSASVLEAFSDWPSYADSKALVARITDGGVAPLVMVSNPPGRMNINVNSGRMAPMPETKKKKKR